MHAPVREYPVGGAWVRILNIPGSSNSKKGIDRIPYTVLDQNRSEVSAGVPMVKYSRSLTDVDRWRRAIATDMQAAATRKHAKSNARQAKSLPPRRSPARGPQQQQHDEDDDDDDEDGVKGGACDDGDDGDGESLP
jgi:hypothetical protein